MVTGSVIKKNEYHDSVFLMRAAQRMSGQPGILQAAALMGTEKNKSLLAEIGVAGAEIAAAKPNDLIVAVKAESQQILSNALASIDQWLQPAPDTAAPSTIRTLEEAITRQPHSNLALISVPGAYAAHEAHRALERGLNVFLFSDNVPVESERSLKEYARQRGLVVMGPDCGTALIAGVGIGFANAVRRGSIGVIGASGTGIQEFTTMVHRAGAGISQALGTGSRDLTDAIGGVSLFSALEVLKSDPQTEVIAILSKPPGPLTLAGLISRIRQCPKPIILCILGLKEDPQHEGIRYPNARTIDEAAALAVEIATGKPSPPSWVDSPEVRALVSREQAGMKPGQKYIRGIFAGGTFCYQTQQIFQEAGITAYSNAPLMGNRLLPDPWRSLEHTLADMGADEFTVGRPHPMIDPSLRLERILTEARDPEVAVLLLDFILGFNASPDPAGDLAQAIAAAKSDAIKRGGSLSVVASICGTEEDPQGLRRQLHVLEESGAVVWLSSAQAARFCACLATTPREAPHG